MGRISVLGLALAAAACSGSSFTNEPAGELGGAAGSAGDVGEGGSLAGGSGGAAAGARGEGGSTSAGGQTPSGGSGGDPAGGSAGQPRGGSGGRPTGGSAGEVSGGSGGEPTGGTGGELTGGSAGAQTGGTGGEETGGSGATGGEPSGGSGGEPTGGTGGVLTGGSGGASTGGSNSGGTGGANTGGGGSHSGGSGGQVVDRCPPQVPDESQRCEDGLVCSYGEDPRVECRPLYTCQDGTWLGSSVTCVPWNDCADLLSAGDVACGELGLECWTGDLGMQCVCLQCSGSSCANELEWTCADAPLEPCPTTPPDLGQPCNEAQVCRYGVCGASSYVSAQCVSGAWDWSQAGCAGTD
jgi:hypothetical protein